MNALSKGVQTTVRNPSTMANFVGLYPVKTMEEITEGYRVPLLMRWYLASRVKKRDWLLLQRE